MALKQSELKEKLDEWAKNQAKAAKLSAKRNAELEPHIAEHNERVKPIIEKYDAQAAPLIEKNSALLKEIEKSLLANTDKDGNPKLLTVTADTATAQVSKSDGARVVSVQKFFDAVKDKTSSFWECLSVGVKKAEGLIGKEKVDEMSDKKTTYSVSLSLNK